jgi:apolipoprotein N-acyltransferase
MMRSLSVALAAMVVLAANAEAQRVVPVGVRRTTEAAPLAIVTQGNEAEFGVGPAPFVVFGTLIGAGAVTLYWVHEFKANRDDDLFIVPPIVFISVGVGGLLGGVMGWSIYKANH